MIVTFLSNNLREKVSIEKEDSTFYGSVHSFYTRGELYINGNTALDVYLIHKV